MKYTSAIQEVFEVVSKKENTGQLATYIPELSKADPQKFGVHIHPIQDASFGWGDYLDKFSIQSIAKVFSLCIAYRILGETIWDRIGVEPSGTSFNSLVQLEADKGIPRNPFINAGALVVCDILISHLNDPKADFLAFVRHVSDNPQLDYSLRIAESEKSVGFRNIALCNFIKSFENIHNDPDEVLDFYFSLCSLEMNCKELSEACLFLANAGCKLSGEKILNTSQTKRINALMQTCGFYDESGEFAFKVGLPGKSGVGGGIIAIHPGNYSISVWSPKLNEKGNSYRGMNFLELFTTLTASSIF
jgi:glutaminase